MLIREMAWMGTYSAKLDRALQRQLAAHYHAFRKTPSLLRTIMRPVLNKKQFPVIIQTCPTLSDSEVTAVHAMVAAEGGNVRQTLPMVSGISTRVTIDAIQKLAAHDHVERIHLDRPVRALLDIAEPTIKAPPVWKHNLTGKGVTVAIVDTGIYPHPDLTKPSNRIIGFKDFVAQKRSPYDDNGHGTHCAGDTAGNGYRSNGKYKGTAPDARLVGVKVLDRNGSGSLSNVVAGVQWCVDNRSRYGIRVISLSLGAAAEESYQNDLLCQAVEKAWKAGIFCCVAAGNEGPRTGTISTPGIDPLVLTVGATDDHRSTDRTDDTVANFSSRGPTIDGLTKPDIVSPGTDIISLRSPKSFLDKQLARNRVGQWYLSMSGTSMATPICAGAAAIIIQKDSTLTPDQIKALLINQADTMGYDPNIQGQGYVNVEQSVNTET